MTKDTQLVSYEQSKRDQLESTLCFLSLVRRFRPETYLDVGCGPGHWVRAADALGIVSGGLDLNVPEQTLRNGSLLSKCDITKWSSAMCLCQLVTCMEVAEHLPPECADNLCSALVDSVSSGGHLVFSAAVPGQGGSGHLNERPHDYWKTKICRLGLTYLPFLTEGIREEFRSLASNAWWYGQNVMVFEK